jgi:hypothetical protein
VWRTPPDINEAPVVSSINTRFDENQLPGTVLLPSIDVYDQDDDDFPTFRIVQAKGVPEDGSEVSSAFRVDPRNGSLTLLRHLFDFEYQYQFKLDMMVTDDVRVGGSWVDSLQF